MISPTNDSGREILDDLGAERVESIKQGRKVPHCTGRTVVYDDETPWFGADFGKTTMVARLAGHAQR